MGYPGKLTLPVDAVPEVVARCYGLQAAVKRVRAGYMSTTLQVSASGQDYLLKAYLRAETSRERIAFGLQVNRHLGACGVPVAEPVADRARELVVEAGGNFFVLWRFLDGEGFQAGNRAQLVAAGRALGRIHQAGIDLLDAAGPAWAPLWEAVREGLEADWRVLGERKEARERVDAMRECLQRLERRASSRDLAGLPRSVIHGDYRAQNLLFRADRVAAVLDMDAARPAPRVFDLAYALAFFPAVVQDRPPGPAEWSALGRGYAREVELTGDERELLPACVQISLLRGLTLWMRIAFLERANERAESWIAAYWPMLEQGEILRNGPAGTI